MDVMMPVDEKQSKPTLPNPRFHIREYNLGVWKLKAAVPSNGGFASLLSPRWFTQRYTRALHTTAPLLWRLAKDVYRVSPRYMTIYSATLLWEAVESPLQMYLNNRLLRALESALVARTVGDGKAIIYALGARLLVTCFSAFASWYGDKIQRIVETQVTRHFRFLALKADLEVDLAASKEHSTQRQPGFESQAWRSVQEISSFATFLLRSLGELGVIANISSSVGGRLFVLMCVAHPVCSHVVNQTHAHHECLAYTVNDDHHRLEALQKLVDGKYKQDVIANGLGGWISTQFQAASERLANIPVGMPFGIIHTPINERPYTPMALSLLGDLPIIFCAVNALFNPGKFSVASLAILQQSALSLHMSTRVILYTAKQFLMSVAQVKKMYSPPSVLNKMRDGALAYPRQSGETGSQKDTKVDVHGMGFELRDVSFSYPGTQTTSNAINGLNLTIKPGQLVVIVGANGSGKSTLIRLLSRLYDPSSGSLLLDGLPSSEYRVADLHRATALLSQDGMLYPLSLRENIGLGYPGYENNEEMVSEAARLGGAMDVVDKMQGSLDTVLDPGIQCFPLNMQGAEKDHPLIVEMAALPKKIDVSGGEKQRIVAARTFMRFNSGSVRFVAVDEPSSALDAEGELKLFENLISAREGKTMVFVTHRFGHLTRYADKIICLKDGVIIEEGSHEHLMKLDGEYANLYNIQASAFLN